MRTSLLVRFAFFAVAALWLGGCSKEAKKARFMDRANGFYEAGELEKARLEYLNVLQLDPQSTIASERVALIWLEEGAPLRALPYMIKVRTMSPENLRMRLKSAEVALALGKRVEARTDALAILESSARLPEALVLLTETVRDQEEFETAQKQLQRFTDHQTVSFQLATANQMLRRGDQGAAKTALQAAITIDPKSVPARLAMGGFYALQDDRKKATEELKTAAGLAPVRSVARMKYAEYLSLTGAAPEAKKYLQDLTRQAPDFLSAWRVLAQIALTERKYDESFALLQNVFNRDPVNYESRSLRAQIWLAKGDTAQAVKEVESLVQDYAGLASARFLQGLVYLQINEEAKAIAALKGAIVQNPDHEEAQLVLANLQIKTGEAPQALAAMVELLKKRPNLAQARALFFEALRVLNRLDDAVRIFREQLKTSPDNAEIHYLLGVVFGMQGKKAEARASFEQSLIRAPNQFQTVVELLNLDLGERNFPAAMKRAQEQLEKAPDAPSSQFLVGRVYAVEGKWSDAEAAAIKSIERDAEFSSGYGLLLECYVAQGKDPEAMARLDALVAKKSGDLRALVMAGDVYMRLNDFQKASAAYEKCLLVNPDFPVALNNLAVIYSERLNQPDRALALARKARQLEPRSPLVTDTLGWVLVKRKEFTEAQALLAEAAGKVPENPEIQYHYGVASQKVGQNEAARAAFQKAAAAKGEFPGKDEIKQRLAELDKTSPAATVPVK